MSRLQGGRAWTVGVGVLSGCFLLAGVTASLSSAAARTEPFEVDHQLCYRAPGKFLNVPTRPVILKNQFNPHGFRPEINPVMAVHCNPVTKTVVGGQTFAVTNPAAHLGCFPITTANKQQAFKVQVANQFGQAVLDTGQPNLLCLPTWNSHTGPPGKKPTAPSGLSHFTCYPVTLVHGAYHPPPVILNDEFGTTHAGVSPVPEELCLPTEKIVTGPTQIFPIFDRNTHLLCFGVSETPFLPKVWDENQFGTAKVYVRATKWLCVPSTKQVIGPAG